MLKDLITASRSYRSFDNRSKITREQLLDWVDCARLCPSTINMQVLKFRLVIKQEECDAMLANTRWAGKIKDMKIPPEGHAPVAYIVICADTDVTETAAEKFLKDVGICAQTILLAATEAGFGGCMIGSFSAERTSTLLSLPANLIPQLVLGLGKPDERVEIVGAAADGSVTYYRENGIHYVQKRALKDLVLE
ncbi:MAG: nitroreductase family protein [Clostridia bacterium]|nr:nitroreductase family protein [Clostridia bacterium]